MKSKIIIFFAVALFGCSTTKNVESQTGYKRVTSSRYVDTTLRMVNPIRPKEMRAEKGKINKIVTSTYTAISYTDSETGENVMYVAPTKDTIDVKVKVKATSTIEERKVDQKTVKAAINYMDRAIVFIAVTLLGVATLIIVKFIHNAFNKPSDR